MGMLHPVIMEADMGRKAAPATKSAAKKSAAKKASANKTTATKASVAGYLAGLESAGRRTEGEALAKIFEKATGWTAQMWGPSIIGFGRYSYTYDSGRQGDMCVVGFSPRKAALSLYLHVSTPETEALFAKLGKARRDVGCIYVNKLADIDLAVLEKFVKASKAAALKAYKDKGWPVAPA